MSVVADYSSEGSTGDEELAITSSSNPPLRAGTYYVALALYTVNTAATATVTATVTSGGGGSTPTITNVVHGANFLNGIVPGSWVAILGSNLAPAGVRRTWRDSEIVSGVLPTSLEGTSVRINGRAASVYFVSPGQLNVQAPDDTSTGPVQVQVTTIGGTAAATAELRTVAPGLFPVALTGSGSTLRIYPAAQIGGRLTGPSNLIPGAIAARSGDVVVLWATGLGPTNPPQPAGRITGVANLVNPLSVTVGGTPATVLFAGVVSAGLYQINIVVPGVPAGERAVQLLQGGAASPSNVYLVIQ